MSANRLKYLKTLLIDMPDDPFIPHALGIEYTRVGNHAKAIKYFRKVIENHPDHIGTYYHLGKAFERIGERRQAWTIYSNGLQKAKNAGDLRTASELQEAIVLIRDLNE